MIHLTYILILLATISNALNSAFNRLNNPLYHKFEVAMVMLYVSVGIFAAFQAYPLKCKERLKLAGWWIFITVLIRFALYSPIFAYTTGNKLTYLGDGAMTDRFWKWLLFDVLNQGPDAIGFLYFCAFAISIMIYLNLALTKK